MTFIEAVAQEEAFGIPGARPTRNNNPGDLEFSPGGIAARHGAIGGDPRFAIFPTVDLGWEWLRPLFVRNCAGLAISAPIARFALASENDTEAYVAKECQRTGMPPDTILT